VQVPTPPQAGGGPSSPRSQGVIRSRVSSGVSDRSENTQNEFAKLMAQSNAEAMARNAAIVMANSRKRQARVAEGNVAPSEVSSAAAPLPPPTSAHRNGARVTHVTNIKIAGEILRQGEDFVYDLNLDEGHTREELDEMGLGLFVPNEFLDVFHSIVDVPHLAIDIEVEPDEEVSVASVCFRNCCTISNSLSDVVGETVPGVFGTVERWREDGCWRSSWTGFGGLGRWHY
jgi:hypothetical protein